MRKKFCVVCKAVAGGRATIFSFRPHNKEQWCGVLGLNPNRIHCKHGVCSDHFLSYTERLAYGNPTEMMEDYVPLEHLAVQVQPSQPAVQSNFDFVVNEFEAGGPMEPFNENAQEYVPESDISMETPDNDVQNLYFTYNEIYETTFRGTRSCIREVLNSRLIVRAMPGIYPEVREMLVAFAESLPISSRKVCLSYDEINVTSDDDDDEVRSCRVFALNSIASEWHCILNYDIIETGLNTIGRLKGAIGECIYIAHQCGFDVSCVSADQCPVSQQFYSNCRTYRCGNFKAKYLPELSSCNPLKKRIWFIPDMTHLLIGITRAILANGAFNVDCTLIMNAIAFYPEASISHFRPGYYHFGLTDIQTVQNVFSNKIINKIIEIEPESEEKTTSVEFMKKIKEFVENFSTLSRDNYESLLNEWILFFNSHECKKIENCLCGLKYIAEEMFNSNEEINTINTKECSTTWIEEIFFYIRNYPYTPKLTLDAFRFHIGRLFSSYVAKGTVRVQLCANYNILLNEIKHYNIRTSYLQD